MAHAYVLGVDQGGTKINIARCTAEGKIEDLRRFAIDLSDHPTAVRQIFAAIETYLDENCRGLPPPVRIGLGVKGYVSRQEGVWKRCLGIPNFSPVDLVALALERFGLPTVVDNDVHAAALAELYYGAGRTYPDFIYYNIGTGIAIGILSAGKLVRGSANYAGEIGHLVTETGGEPCPCGQFGCLEATASGAAIIAQAERGLATHPESALRHDLKNSALTSHAVFVRAQEGDALALAIRQRALRSIQVSVVAILNIFNPAAIIFGGGVMADGLLLPEIKAYAEQLALRPAAWALQEIRLSELGAGNVGVLGAAAIGWEDIQQK